MDGQFALPLAFDLAATFFFAVSGGLTAMRKEYDFVGVFVLALVTGLGGGLLRDGLFLQQPPAVMDTPYLLTVAAATALCLAFGERLNRLPMTFMLADAVGLGLYAMVGTQKALLSGMPWVPAMLVGVVNAVGGGVVRDLLTREAPLVFRPGEFYAAAAFAGSALFVALALGLGVSMLFSALAGVTCIVAIRVASVRFGWKTKAAVPLIDRYGKRGGS